MPIINLVGNGPSRKLFSKYRNPAKTVGFNFCDDFDETFVSDPHVIKQRDPNEFPHKKLTVLEKEITNNGKMNTGYNTAQCAYLELRKRGYYEFHMYGFDLMWSNNFESLTDQTINKDRWVQKALDNNLNDIWNQYWTDIIDTITYIYIPSDIPTDSLRVNNEHTVVKKMDIK